MGGEGGRREERGGEPASGMPRPPAPSRGRPLLPRAAPRRPPSSSRPAAPERRLQEPPARSARGLGGPRPALRSLPLPALPRPPLLRSLHFQGASSFKPGRPACRFHAAPLPPPPPPAGGGRPPDFLLLLLPPGAPRPLAGLAAHSPLSPWWRRSVPGAGSCRSRLREERREQLPAELARPGERRGGS